MKKLILLAAGFFTLMTGNLYAQRNCGTMEYLETQLQQDLGLHQRMENIERFTEEWVRENGNGERTVINIPVVVHVVYNTSAQNVSDAMIQAQIDVLNADFRALNADVTNTPSIFAGVVADCEINFCLAQRDPNGNPTNGITRTSTTRTSFSSNDYVKYTSQGGKDAWPASSYLNLWVCNLGSGLLGYAQFPGGAAATDGVVVLYSSLPGGTATNYNGGRTATHEVGHWLNLRHIWGDATCGSDLVNDTPTHNTSNGGCPSYPHYSTCSGTPVEMTMNYMDYTYDACMYMFTQGQKTRMSAIFAPGGARQSITTSQGCVPLDPNACGVASGLAASNVTQTSATLSWSAGQNAVSYNVQYKPTAGSTWTSASTTATSLAVSGLTVGTAYEFQVQTVCASTTSAFTASANFTTQSPVTCTNDSYEANETQSAARSISVGSSYYPKVCGTTDVDWFKFSNSSSKRNIRVTIKALPANYDMQLYNSAGTLLGTSANAGTADEGFIYNSAPVGTYYVKIYGNSGAQSNSTYTLKAETNRNSYSGFRLDEDAAGAEEMVENTLMLYPNPAADNLTLNYFSLNEESVTVRIFDLMGKTEMVQQKAIETGDNYFSIDVTNFAKGLYFVEISGNESRIVEKLMIAK
ncbi:MAG: hypothetical protein POELPBGB_03504 [Bacteroidia bacterium]|nr:hypothetical protein [Bacteroidia bacterium]